MSFIIIILVIDLEMHFVQITVKLLKRYFLFFGVKSVLFLMLYSRLTEPKRFS